LNTSWNASLAQLTQRGEACVLVTIFSTKGSTPRASGSKMLVSGRKSYYSIGGGHLEHQAIKLARQILEDHDSQAFIKSFSLGPSLGQCCGGQLELLFEAFYPAKQKVAIFGAGHIAKALVPILGQLPCAVQWIDSRAELFPEQIPENTTKIIQQDLVSVVSQLADHSYVLIMTHNHQLDQSLCEALLKQPQPAFIGLIGSATKWKKFQLRLARKGYSAEQIESICCPIGLTDSRENSQAPANKGKLPMEIAVSVSAQLIDFYNRDDPADRQSSPAAAIKDNATEIIASDRPETVAS